MASRRLTKILKEEIEEKIKLFVLEKIEKSSIYKEQQNRIELIIESIRKVVCEKCPEHEMAILVKHGETQTINSVLLTIGERNKQIVVVWSKTKNVFTLDFDPGILCPSSWGSSRLFKKVCRNEEVKNMILMAVKADNHIQCEVQETTKAYMEIVDQYNTMKQLLDKNPSFEKFIPEEKKPQKKVTHEKALNIIKTFENE